MLWYAAGTNSDGQRSAQTPARWLDLAHVYGVHARDARDCVLVNRQGKVVYMAGALGVVGHVDSNSQVFFRGHDADLRCISQHPNEDVVASGTLSLSPSLSLLLLTNPSCELNH